MSPVTFGLRGAAARKTDRTAAADPSTARADPVAAPSTGGDTIVAALPILTVCLTLLLVAVFTLEVKRGFGTGTTIDDETLTAFGATSRAAVIGGAEIWRVPLAPLLHGSREHLLGNAFSLLSIGLLLEPLVGHGWFMAIFCLGALGATVASLLGNPAEVVAVGASGGIMALVAAAFLLSWHPRASQDAATMFRRSLLFGGPALLPMVLHLPHQGAVQVDYQAHLGGAVVGLLMAVGLQAVWPAEDRRPRARRWSRAIVLAWLAAVGVSAGFAAAGRARPTTPPGVSGARGPAPVSRLIPSEALPSRFTDGIPLAETFLRLYPQDPRSHLLQALAWQRMGDVIDAEREFHRASDLIDNDEAHLFDAMKPAVLTALALTQWQLGRPLEAKATAASPCRANGGDKASLVRAGLCR